MSVMETRDLLKKLSLNEQNDGNDYQNENVCCLNSLLVVKMNGSTHTANTAISSTTGRKSGIEDHNQECKEEEYTSDPLLTDNAHVIPKSLEDSGGNLLRLIEGRSMKSNSDKQCKLHQV
jgi:hypothetical protein